jgi:Mn2+/Fe2+ NRAMP family transporter
LVQFPNLSPTHCPSVTDLRHRSSSVTDLRLYLAIGIIGATVMPHNLYLHSALVQSR